MSELSAMPWPLVVRGTMVLATIAWSAGEVLMRRSPALDRLARGAWTIGIALALVHVVLAFAFVYRWDHAAAVAATAMQTELLVGSRWGAGIYVNYVFLALWLADAVWWWGAPASHASRSRRIEIARFAVFAFMFFNGAVVFASPATRGVGLAAVVAAVLAQAVSRRPQMPDAAALRR